MYQTVQSLELFVRNAVWRDFQSTRLLTITLEIQENSHLILSEHNPESDKIFDLASLVQKEVIL